MSDIFDKLDYLSETKSLIKNAIISAGGSVTDNTAFRNYAVAISEISPQTSIGYTPVEYDSSLDYLNETKKSIKSAISNKGVSIDDNTTFREYANKILQISPKVYIQVDGSGTGDIKVTENTNNVTITKGNTTLATANKTDTICFWQNNYSTRYSGRINLDGNVKVLLGENSSGGYSPINIIGNGRGGIDVYATRTVTITLANPNNETTLSPNKVIGGTGGAGIKVQTNTTGDIATAIFNGNGFLEATGGSGDNSGAGIGGYASTPGGNISILGNAHITAVGGARAAGIGGGSNSDTNTGGDAGTIIIGSANSNPTVTATGGLYGSGIGTSNYCKSSITPNAITINSGTVIATAGDSAAGIGGGASTNKPPSITITGGNVTANGGTKNADATGGGAGIGNGCYNKNVSGSGIPGTINITGGTITAISGGTSNVGAGIGNGGSTNSAGGSLTITGSPTVRAYSPRGNMAINANLTNSTANLISHNLNTAVTGTTTLTPKYNGANIEAPDFVLPAGTLSYVGTLNNPADGNTTYYTLTANDGRMIRLISNINDTTMETVKIIIPYTPVTLNINN